MAHQELFAKRTFATEAAAVTGGAAIWQDPPEIQLETVQSDGFLVIRSPHLLAPLAAPWPEARAHEEVMVELKISVTDCTPNGTGFGLRDGDPADSSAPGTPPRHCSFGPVGR